jgi:putative alpha-1,2-mannosidase
VEILQFVAKTIFYLYRNFSIKMRKTVLLLSLLVSIIAYSQNKDHAKQVNPFIGTGGHGHTFPGDTVPFGMVQLSPDTRIDGSWDGCSGYHYSDSVIYGFSHTHLDGTGVSDFGDIMLMPMAKGIKGFDHNKAFEAAKHSAMLDIFGLCL